MSEHREGSVTRATLDLTEVAALLGCSRSSAYRWAKDGTLPSIRLGGRVVVPRAAIAQLLDPAPPPPASTGLHGDTQAAGSLPTVDDSVG